MAIIWDTEYEQVWDLIRRGKPWATHGDPVLQPKMNLLLSGQYTDSEIKAFRSAWLERAIFPVQADRGSFSLRADNEEQYKQLLEFLGIKPIGVSLLRYLRDRGISEINAWRDYWNEIWRAFGRYDLVGFTNTQADFIIEEKGEVLYPKTISRGLLSFEAKSSEEEKQLQEFLGIEPPGDDLVTYISKLDKTGLLEWKNYWDEIFARLDRDDIITFIRAKYNEYINLLPPPTEPPTEPEPPPPEKTWWEKVLDTLGAIVYFPFTIAKSAVDRVYSEVTDIPFTEDEWMKTKLPAVEFFTPLNELSKLFFGENLSGEKEEFSPVLDSVLIVLTFFPFIKPAKLVVTSSKMMGKLGSKGFLKLFATKTDDAVKLFSKLNVDDQLKYGGDLLKNTEGRTLLRSLIEKKAITGHTAETLVTSMQRKAVDEVLIKKGFAKVFAPRTILWGFTGILGAITSAYGISFGTEWFAKEGMWEMYTIPLSDMMRDYRFDPTLEKAKLIRARIDNLKEVLPKTQKLVRSVAWLWPFTKDHWLTWVDGIEFEIETLEEEFNLIILPELVELPEEVKGIVRDIIDGDTIDLDLSIPFSDDKLPEYKTTGHARVRVVGINAPEKSPKGEILCTDIEIFEVDKKWADESRDRLLPLNDKEITLKIDPEKTMDTYGRILAVVVHNGVDIGLRQIKEGLACRYFREENKYVDDDLYKAETLKAKDNEIGMWEGFALVEEEIEKGKILFSIDSDPSNAKVFLNGTATHHNTPTDEVEQEDMKALWTEGKHILKVTKSGMEKEVEIELVRDEKFELVVDLTAMVEPEEPEVPEEPEEPEVPEEPEEPEVPEDVTTLIADLIRQILELQIRVAKLKEEEPPEVPPEIPLIYTEEQLWALRKAFTEIWNLTEGAKQLSDKERVNLIASFNMYSVEQREALTPLWEDIERLTIGRAQLSKKEFDDLKIKYGI